MNIPESARAAVRSGDSAAFLRLVLQRGGRAAAAALLPAAGADLSATQATLLRAAAAAVPPDRVWVFAERCFVRAKLPVDALAACALARRGDERAHLVLRRNVLGPRLGSSDELDAVYAALSFSAPERRDVHLDRVEHALRAGDANALRELAQPAALPPIPDGHELVDAGAGVGKTSRVCRLRRKTDGADVAWKIPVTDDPRTRAEMEEAVARSQRWVQLGISQSPIEWAPGGSGLLQPFVAGPTLAERVQGGGGPLVERGDEHAALVDLVLGLVQRGGFVSGLNVDNLVFDGVRWHVIDSGRVDDVGDVRSAWPRQRKELLRKWTRTGGAKRRAAVVSFLDAVEARLAPADRPSAAARVVRRLRGH